MPTRLPERDLPMHVPARLRRARAGLAAEARDNPARLDIAALLHLMTQAVLFGVGAIVILSTPWLAARATIAFPAMIAAAILAGAAFAWVIAPRLQARYWRRRRLLALVNPAPVNPARRFR